MKRFLFFILVMGGIGGGQALLADENPQNSLATIVFHTKNGQFTYTQEQAITKSEKEKGLMNRQEMPEKGGMVFIYHPAQYVGIWMKNTFIPLDVVFIDCDNRAHKIYPNMIPQSLTPVFPDQKICYISELKAGQTQKMGLRLGDQAIFMNSLKWFYCHYESCLRQAKKSHKSFFKRDCCTSLRSFVSDDLRSLL